MTDEFGQSENEDRGVMPLIIGCALFLAFVIYFGTSKEELPLSASTIKLGICVVPTVLIGLIVLYAALFGNAEESNRKYEELRERCQIEAVRDKSVLDDFLSLAQKCHPKGPPSFSNVYFQRNDHYPCWLADLYFPPSNSNSIKSLFIKRRARQCLTVLCIESKSHSWPRFNLRSKSFGRMQAEIGWRDVSFPEHPQFLKLFHLMSPDDDLVREVFSSELLEFLENYPRAQIFSDSQRLMISLSSQSVFFLKYEKYLDRAFEFIQFLEDGSSHSSH